MQSMDFSAWKQAKRVYEHSKCLELIKEAEDALPGNTELGPEHLNDIEALLVCLHMALQTAPSGDAWVLLWSKTVKWSLLRAEYKEAS